MTGSRTDPARVRPPEPTADRHRAPEILRRLGGTPAGHRPSAREYRRSCGFPCGRSARARETRTVSATRPSMPIRRKLLACSLRQNLQSTPGRPGTSTRVDPCTACRGARPGALNGSRRCTPPQRTGRFSPRRSCAAVQLHHDWNAAGPPGSRISSQLHPRSRAARESSFEAEEARSPESPPAVSVQRRVTMRVRSGVGVVHVLQR